MKFQAKYTLRQVERPDATQLCGVGTFVPTITLDNSKYTTTEVSVVVHDSKVSSHLRE